MHKHGIRLGNFMRGFARCGFTIFQDVSLENNIRRYKYL